ncbi:TPA: oligosaccharide flippase family protein [Vibrio vulnificus]|nr:oligosaccharide flippase family protein [Vibrio vulnificus]
MKNIIKKFISVMSGNIVVVATSFIIAALIVQRYGMENYGKFVVVQSIFMVFPILTRPLVWQAFVKFKNEVSSIELFKYSLKIEALFFVFLSLLFILILRLMLFLFPNNDYFLLEKPYFIIAILFLSFFYNSGAVIGYYRSRENYVVISLILSISSISKVVFLLFSDLDISSLIFFLCIIDATIWFLSIFFSYLIINKTKSSIRCKIKNKIKIKFLKYSLWGNLHSILDLPVSHLDRLIVSVLFSVEMAGVFNLIKRVGGIAKQLSDPILQILFPKFVDFLHSGDVSKIRTIKHKLKYLSIFLGILTVSLGWIGFDLFDKLMFKGGLYEYKIEIILFALAQIYAFSFTWIHPLCISLSAMLDVTKVTFWSNVIYLFILTIGIQYFSMYGMILATFVQYYFVIYMKRAIIKGKLIGL